MYSGTVATLIKEELFELHFFLLPSRKTQKEEKVRKDLTRFNKRKLHVLYTKNLNEEFRKNVIFLLQVQKKQTNKQKKPTRLKNKIENNST